MKTLIALSALALASPAFSAVTVTFENAGVQNTTASFDFVGTETFDARSTGGAQSFSTDFGTAGDPVVINGSYSNVSVNAANQYGGAGGTGNFANAGLNSPYELTLSASDGSDITYFGYWLSALDGGNNLTFYKGSTLVYAFTPSDVISAIGGNAAYFGNPTGPFLGQNGNEPYAFVNLYFTGGTSFDRVVFSQTTSAGYESDNHTVGYYTEIGGNPIPGVPEAATWAMMIAGFGLVGASLRRRQALAA